jgi:hypothetical protein
MTDRTHFEPGSPLPLSDFHAWFRGGAIWRANQREVPAALAANAPGCERPFVTEYQMTGTPPPPIGELVPQLVVNWINGSAASQIGLSLPFGNAGDGYHLLLLSIDETGYIAEHAEVGVNGQVVGLEEMPPDSPWPFAEWQGLLARNAGYREGHVPAERAGPFAQTLDGIINRPPAGADRKRASLGRGTERRKPQLTVLTDPPSSSRGEHGQEYRQGPTEPQQRSGLEPEQ